MLIELRHSYQAYTTGSLRYLFPISQNKQREFIDNSIDELGFDVV